MYLVPDGFKDLWTREKRLKWKDVKDTYICSLHFESMCFSGRKLIVVSENLPDQNYIEQHSSVNSKSAEELKRENAMLTEKIQTIFEENN